MDFKNGVMNIQAAVDNGARMVHTSIQIVLATLGADNYAVFITATMHEVILFALTGWPRRRGRM